MKSEEFANAIFALYPPFRNWDDTTLQVWTNTVVSECGTYSDRVRAEAFKSLTRVEHKNKPPQPATIFDHCQEARRWVEGEKPALPIVDKAVLAWEEQEKIADMLIKTPDGKRMAREDWFGPVWEHCRSKRRMPKEVHEIAKCKRAYQEWLATYEDVVRGGPQWEATKQHAARRLILVAMGTTMQRRWEEKRKLALGA